MGNPLASKGDLQPGTDVKKLSAGIYGHNEGYDGVKDLPERFGTLEVIKPQADCQGGNPKILIFISGTGDNAYVMQYWFRQWYNWKKISLIPIQ